MLPVKQSSVKKQPLKKGCLIIHTDCQKKIQAAKLQKQYYLAEKLLLHFH